MKASLQYLRIRGRLHHDNKTWDQEYPDALTDAEYSLNKDFAGASELNTTEGVK